MRAIAAKSPKSPEKPQDWQKTLCATTPAPKAAKAISAPALLIYAPASTYNPKRQRRARKPKLAPLSILAAKFRARHLEHMTKILGRAP